VSAAAEQKRPAGSWEASQRWIAARDEVVDEVAALGLEVRDLPTGWGVVDRDRMIAGFSIDADGAFAGGWVETQIKGFYRSRSTRESWSAALTENLEKKAAAR
jgi:hypothetical protein